VPILNDAADDGDRTVILTLSNPGGGALLSARGTATLTITDNDAGGTIQFGATNYNVSESGGSVTVTVTRSGGSASVASVDYATSNGTATAGADYTATSGSLTFAAGRTSRTFTVAIANDGTAEANETIALTLSNPAGGAVLGTRSSATVTIVDND
jgi:hypothetical protein